jgi:mono/diheme cytochrome c family protein
VPSLRLRRQGSVRSGALAIALIGLSVLVGCDASENADTERGRQLFLSNCGTCHTLAQAGSSANVGPNLDAAFYSARADGMDNDTIEGVVQTQIAAPREIEQGVPNYEQVYMPADLVSGQDAEDVAAYVASVAGVPGAKPPELAPAQLFTEKCGICHAFNAAGTAGGVGPNLDEALAGKDAAYIEKQIVDPNSEIAAGFQPDVMPQDFGTSLTPEDLKGLVDYLLDPSSAKGSSN